MAIVWVAPESEHSGVKNFDQVTKNAEEAHERFFQESLYICCNNDNEGNYFYLTSVEVRNWSQNFGERIWQVVAIIL